MFHLYKLILLIFITNVATTFTYASDSTYTKMGAGPKYWIAYEHCFVNNVPIPEDRWKQNIDWVDKNFKDYGYDMICNDGWKNDFKYWYNYLKQKNMRMGVYYNPMWMTKAAYDQNVKVIGTKHKAQDLAGARSFNEPLYWVDATKPGAKEWIQGYVQYFIDCGATYLRIDFLENYERNYGTVNYELCLKWIKEAAGDKLFLSLVMPNCYEHGRAELKYGDMIRIDDDCFQGGWDFFSERRRGLWNPIWPQYGNAFDGFIKFADIGGRGQMVLDGDFIRLNTMDTDIERMSMISLFTMAGSPICIADQYDTIEGSEWVYQNKELIALNDAGFVGKPLSYDDKDVNNSSRWAGQLPNGDWVVGLFNREKNNQIRSIDFLQELGLDNGNASQVRDLWKHEDLGSMQGGYSVELLPHESKVLLIKSSKIFRYEAEVASMMGGAKRGETYFGASGFGYAEMSMNTENKLLFAIETSITSKYKLNIRYKNSNDRQLKANISVDKGVKSIGLAIPAAKEGGKWSVVNTEILLNSGVNFLSISNNDAKASFAIDYIEILPLGK